MSPPFFHSSTCLPSKPRKMNIYFEVTTPKVRSATWTQLNILTNRENGFRNILTRNWNMELKFKIEVSNNHFVVETFGRLIEWSLFLKRNPFSCSDFIMFRNSKMTDFFNWLQIIHSVKEEKFKTILAKLSFVVWSFLFCGFQTNWKKYFAN